MKLKLSALTMSLCFLAPALAAAQEIGSKGDVVFSAERLMGISGTHAYTQGDPSPNDYDNDWTGFSFGWRGPISADGLAPFDVPRLAFDYLVIDHLSIGGSLGYASLSPDGNGQNDVSMFMLAPRVGYLHSFGRVVAIWPRGGFTYHSASFDPGYDESGFALSLECAFTFSPVEHFAFQVGPTFDIDMFGEQHSPGDPDRDRKYRAFGINAGLLGWF